jgi:uncharacterized protein involved in exopolysaccharide biosynthesis
MMDYDADHRLFRRIAKLKRHWRWILAGTGLCGVVTLFVSLFLPKVYRATTYLLISESKIGQSSQLSAWQFATLPTYVPFVDNDALIDSAIRKFHLDRPPYSLNLDRFRREDILDVQTPRSTRLLELSVEFSDPRLAADLANYLAQGAGEFNERMNTADTLATQKFLKEQLDQANERLGAAAKRRLDIQQKARIEEKENQLQILLAEKQQLSDELRKLRLALAQDRSRSESLGRALKTEPPTISLKKSVLSDRLLERSLDKLDPQSGSQLSMKEETLNTIHQQIQGNYVASAASAAAENAGIKEASKRLAEIDIRLDGLLVETTRLRSELEDADHEYKLASTAVATASQNYQSASVTVSAKSQDLKQLAPALVPERPVRPRVLLYTIIGILLSLTLFTGIALTMESVRDLRFGAIRLIEEEEEFSKRQT